MFTSKFVRSLKNFCSKGKIRNFTTLLCLWVYLNKKRRVEKLGNCSKKNILFCKKTYGKNWNQRHVGQLCYGLIRQEPIHFIIIFTNVKISGKEFYSHVKGFPNDGNTDDWHTTWDNQCDIKIIFKPQVNKT